MKSILILAITSKSKIDWSRNKDYIYIYIGWKRGQSVYGDSSIILEGSSDASKMKESHGFSDLWEDTKGGSKFLGLWDLGIRKPNPKIEKRIKKHF